VRLDPGDYLVFLNYAITLHNGGDFEKAKGMFQTHDALFDALDEDGKIDAGDDVAAQRDLVRKALMGS
jgi:hypothetical protein